MASLQLCRQLQNFLLRLHGDGMNSDDAVWTLIQDCLYYRRKSSAAPADERKRRSSVSGIRRRQCIRGIARHNAEIAAEEAPSVFPQHRKSRRLRFKGQHTPPGHTETQLHGNSAAAGTDVIDQRILPERQLPKGHCPGGLFRHGHAGLPEKSCILNAEAIKVGGLQCLLSRTIAKIEQRQRIRLHIQKIRRFSPADPFIGIAQPASQNHLCLRKSKVQKLPRDRSQLSPSAQKTQKLPRLREKRKDRAVPPVETQYRRCLPAFSQTIQKIIQGRQAGYKVQRSLRNTGRREGRGQCCRAGIHRQRPGKEEAHSPAAVRQRLKKVHKLSGAEAHEAAALRRTAADFPVQCKRPRRTCRRIQGKQTVPSLLRETAGTPRPHTNQINFTIFGHSRLSRFFSVWHNKSPF